MLGGAAITRGDVEAAFEILHGVAPAAMTDTMWLMLAHSACATSRPHEAKDAADKVITAHPAAPRAYIIRADAARALEDDGGASAFYKAALARAAVLADTPESLRSEIARAKTARAELEAGYSASLEAGLVARGVSDDLRSARFAQSLAILNGTATIQLQRPSAYYFPGLPQREFYEREEFDWVSTIEAATTSLIAEVETAISDHEAFTPYLVDDPDRPARERHGLTDNPAWSSLTLTADGDWTEAARTRFPATVAALDNARVVRRR